MNAHCPTPRKRALSIGCGDGNLELTMLRLGACEHLVAVELSQARLERVRAATPPELVDRLELVCANIETWRPEGRFDLVVANGIVHHLQGLEAFFDMLDEVLTRDGIVYVDEFVGPSRFQWTDKQIELINRLLARLSPELRRDLVESDLELRPPLTRPSIAGLVAADPSEAARSAEIPDLLHQRLDTVEEREWGGAIFHQLFNRIMGNFAEHDDLVRVIMEVDAILTEERIVSSDYLWGVYRRRDAATPQGRAKFQVDGRIEAIEGAVVVGWAAASEEPRHPLSVDVYIDHRLTAKTIADLPRSDLRGAGIGDGAHAFRVPLPSWIRDGGHHSLSVVVPATGTALSTAHGWNNHNRSTPDGTTFSFARHLPGMELPPSRVLSGREGWAFSCDDELGSIEQLLGRLRLTEPDLNCYEELLSRRAQRLERLGIMYILGIVPAKAGIHPEQLPAARPRLAAPKLAHQLLTRLAHTAVNTVDLHTPLRAAATRGAQLYHKRDVHWKYQGALIASEALTTCILNAGVMAREVPPTDIRWRRESFEGDLSGRPAVMLEGGQLISCQPTRGTEIAIVPDASALGLRRASLPSILRECDPGASLIERAEHTGGPTALVLTDPDGGRLEPLLSAAFGRSIWMSGRSLNMAVVEMERPAVVVELLDESRLVRVPYGLEA